SESGQSTLFGLGRSSLFTPVSRLEAGVFLLAGALGQGVGLISGPKGREAFWKAPQESVALRWKNTRSLAGACAEMKPVLSFYEARPGCGKKSVLSYKTLVFSTIYVIMASYLAEMHGRNITSWQGQIELPCLKKRVDCRG
ncbi:MAG TPA: hypothetical protein PK461_11530, partial [Alcaligenes faecalis]|nr:hypothetical protein [Alcaligenes faecalis]